MKPWLVIALCSLASAPSVVFADTLGAEPQDYGKVTHIKKGVKEIDLGGIFVLSHSKNGDAEGNTRVSSLSSLGFQYFINDNFSAGGAALFGYDRLSNNTYSTGFGGMAFASLHVRLGLGAFLRPLIGGGLLVGNLSTEVTPGMTTSASQVSGLVRIGLPFAYFPSRRIVLQAGPELNISVGSTTPDAGDSQSFVSVTGGFGVSAGYAF
jgi:hypothetical protein